MADIISLKLTLSLCSTVNPLSS